MRDRRQRDAWSVWVIGALFLAVPQAACADEAPRLQKAPKVMELPKAPSFEKQRERLVREVSRTGVTDEAVLDALRRVPRHEFVPEEMRRYSYLNNPLPIGEEQTISQPTIVGLMTQLARPTPDARILEVGTGSGYQAAVLAELAGEVYSIEIVPALAKRARATLERLGYAKVKTRIGDGYRGWPEAAPFDAIVVTAAPPYVPQPLKDQLKVGGRLVLPVGPDGGAQVLKVITRTAEGYREREVIGVAFVPMTGEAQKPKGR
jgi:protein-L-isoaspartate(D-aspartate) O-methyltransferase